MLTRDSISVVIPVFNNEQHLQETIDSLRYQSFDNWEAIIVDDGSTDKTKEIVLKNAENDSRIKYLQRGRGPKGGSTCRNIGLFAANGEYVVFLDGDDILSSDCLDHRLALIKGSDLDFVVFPMASFKVNQEDYHKLSRSDVRCFDYYFMTGSAVWQVTSPLYRTSFARKINGFDERFKRFQDVEFGLRATAISNGKFKSFCELEPDCFYRVPAGQYALSPEKLRKGLESYGFFLDEIITLRKQGYLDKRYKYSLGVLATYANILHLIDILKERNEEVMTFEAYNSTDIRSEMLWHHRFVFFLLRMFTRPLKLHLHLTHMCNQYCRLHYLKM